MSRIIRVEVWQVDLAPRAHAPDAARQPAGQETPMVRIVADDGANGTGWSQVAAARGAGVTIYATLLGCPSRAQRNEDLAGSLAHERAVGEILRVINASPTDVQPEVLVTFVSRPAPSTKISRFPVLSLS